MAFPKEKPIVPQTHDDFVAHLQEQRCFLRASADLFDGGSLAEAKRLATTIRVLVYDGRPGSNSVSLLRHLGIKDEIRFGDSVGHEVPPEAKIAVSLVSMGFGPSGLVYSASLDPGSAWRSVDFDLWWSMVIMKTLNGDTFSRASFVKSLANQDGGAHVDAVLERPYEGLSREVTLKWEGGITSPGSPVPVGVRQIAHELSWTLDRELPRLLPDDFS